VCEDREVRVPQAIVNVENVTPGEGRQQVCSIRLRKRRKCSGGIVYEYLKQRREQGCERQRHVQARCPSEQVATLDLLRRRKRGGENTPEAAFADMDASQEEIFVVFRRLWERGQL
jgi:hypothetical protein